MTRIQRTFVHLQWDSSFVFPQKAAFTLPHCKPHLKLRRLSKSSYNTALFGVGSTQTVLPVASVPPPVALQLSLVPQPPGLTLHQPSLLPTSQPERKMQQEEEKSQQRPAVSAAALSTTRSSPAGTAKVSSPAQQITKEAVAQ